MLKLINGLEDESYDWCNDRRKMRLGDVGGCSRIKTIC